LREDNVWEFFYLLNQITWQEVHIESDVNEKCNSFLDIFLHTTVHLRESVRKNWINPGIKKLQQKYVIFIHSKEK